jgi:cytochrome c nitrite reductase small subunit
VDLRRIVQALDPGRLSDVLLDPRAHLPEVTILIGILIVLLLLLVVVAAIALAPPPERGEDEPRWPRSTGEAARLRLRWRRVGGWGAMAAVVALLLAAFVYTGRPQTCSGCHSKPDVVRAWSKGVHGSVACFACHAAPGPLGAIAARAWVAGDILRSQARLSPTRRDPFVSDESCTSCHRTQLLGTIVVASVRMSHREPLAAAASCVDCHAGAAHGDLVGAQASPAMSSCLPCHDDTKASAKCATCHVEDVGAVNRTSLAELPKMPELGKPTTCRGCHPIDSCNKCHGLELPHSDEFVKSGHAMQAAFEKKSVCKKCHSITVFCNESCHLFNSDGSSPHLPGFRASHASPGQQSCGCHRLSRQAMCSVCHGAAKK